MEIRRRQPIGIELVKRGVVTEKDIEKALEYQREHKSRKLGDILHILNLCDAETLINAIGEIVGYKGIILKNVKLNFSEYVSPEVARANKIIPFEVSNRKIKI